MVVKEKKQKKFLDIQANKKRQAVATFRSEISNKKNVPTLFSRGKRMESFFTEDSKLYISPRQQEALRKGIGLDNRVGKWDSLSSRVVNKFVCAKPGNASVLLKALENRYAILNESANEMVDSFTGQFSMVRLWNASIIGSILFGMVMMTFVYRYLGQGVSADSISVQQPSQSRMAIAPVDTNNDAESFAKQVMEIQKADDRQSLEKEIKEMVKGYPIEKMAPYIAQKDRTVAAFIVAIARKESSWGVHVPVLNGQDCFNYWGYRGQRKLMGTGGHTCFNSPKDAVDTVAKRITTLVEEQGKDTPQEMVKTWKCGGNCAATGGQAAANKWVSDVNGIFKEFDMQD